MKIVSVSTYRVAPRWLFVKIDTDEGLSGWGEPSLEGHTQAVDAAVHALSQLLLGQDPARINDLWQLLYRGGFYRGGPVLMSALAGLDQALWDLKGKALGVPVYQLLGGLVRDRVKTYCWVGGDRPAELVAAIESRIAQGFDLFKMNLCAELHWVADYRAIDAAIARIGDVRAAFGDRIGFGIDFHGRVPPTLAKTLLRELEPLRPLFVEEPVAPDYVDHYPALAAQTPIPLAAGERLYGCDEFRRLFAAGGVGIAQPDLSHAGGITAGLRIAALADSHGIALAPHCPLGPLALAACLQLDCVAPNAGLQEQSLRIHYNAGSDLFDYLRNPEDFAVSDGYLRPLPKPGLGVELDEARVIAAAAVAPDWQTPVWRHPDGGLAEW